MDPELAKKFARQKQRNNESGEDEFDNDDHGVEILDSNVSTTSSAITHKMDKNPQRAVQVDSGALPPVQEKKESSEQQLETPPTTVQVSNRASDKVLANVGMETQVLEENIPSEAHIGDVDSVVSSLHNEPHHQHHYNHPPQAYQNNNNTKVYSSMQQAENVIVENSSEEYYEEEEEEDEEAARALRKRNTIIIIMLLIFLGLVVAIGAGIGLAMTNSNNDDSNNNDDGTALQDGKGIGSDGGGSSSTTNNDDEYSGLGGGLDADDAYATTVPSTAPTFGGPCIPLEIGIIFDEYSDETGWMLVEGNYYPEDETMNNIVWESKYYSILEYAQRADTFRKCFAPGYYTFVFTDKEGDGICCYHGEGSYVLSSEGKVITIGGQMTGLEETTVFELPYVEPNPVDSNGDGKDDRLGSLMPYDSSGMTEGVDCENFRLVILTDEYGVETTWELYEGLDRKTGTLVANGGPYGSEYTYVIDYCLASPKQYALYMYDWDGRGLCCEYGEGWYQVTSGDIVIQDKTGQFGEVNITQFVLPADGSVILTTESPTSRPTTPWVESSEVGKKTLFPTKAPIKGGDVVDQGGLPADFPDVGGGGRR